LSSEINKYISDSKITYKPKLDFMKKILTLFTLLLMAGSLALAQTVQITGTVTSSEDGLPLPGVTVFVKGTTLGILTGTDGKYSLSVPATEKTLVFSYIGFKSQEVSIENQTKIDVVLQLDVFKVDEVVVVGYGVQKKREVTGSISTVKGDALASLATPSFDAQLAGRSAGVQVNTMTGILGEVPRLRIRGTGSISSGTYPLVVVDGVPIFTGDQGGAASTNALGDINPADIESTEILKDGSGTAIYGSRAANGVILITTKRGSGGKFHVNYNNYFGIASPVKLFDLLGAADFVTISNEKRSNRGQANWASNDGAAYPGRVFDTDWQRAVLKTNAKQQDHNLSFSGSTDKSTYYFSLGYTKQEGVTIPNEMQRYSFRGNADQKIKKWLTVGASIAVTKNDYSGLNTGSNSLSGNIFSAIRQLPNTPIYNSADPTGYNIEPGTNLVGKWNNVTTIGDNLPNIVYTLKNNVQTSKVFHTIADAYMQFFILPSLNFKTQFGVDNSMAEGFQYWNPIHGDGKSSLGLVYNDFRNQMRWNLQNILSFNKTFASFHNVGVVLVNEFQSQRINNFYGQGTNLSNEFFRYNLISGTYGIQTSGGGLSENGFISYAGRLNYNFKGKYFLQGSLRYDGISSLPSANRYGLFPGVSAGWTISKESFMEPINNVVSDLKVRASYAKVGNVNIGYYPYFGLYGSAKYADYNGIAFSQAGNDQLKWETSTKYDVGFDALFLDGKYKLTFDYYLNNQDGLILAAPTPPSLGIPGNSINKNIGSMKNWGYEFSAEAFIVRNNDFTWSIDGNLTLGGNKVTGLYNNLDMIYNYNIIRVGESYNAIYGYQYLGVNWVNGNPLYRKGDGQIVQANVPTSTYVNYDPANPANVSVAATQLGNADKRILGTSLPKYFGAINTKVSYKGFDLTCMFRFSGGNVVMNRTRMDLLGQNFTNNSKEILGRWKSTSENGDGVTPILWAAGGNFVNLSDQASTRWVEKGNYFKLSTLTLGYTFPKSLLRSLNIESLRVFAQGQDIFMIAPYKGIDPEMENGGVDYNGTPRQRVITFGINLSL
jgi:TonB-dependent starch-binding outer membrane protein SusC